MIDNIVIVSFGRMIELSQVSKRFGSQRVINNISFKINEGEIVGLLGPNGAGKTTTLRMITGVLPASSGRVMVEDENPLDNVEVRKKLGYLPEDNPLYRDMTVEEWLKYWVKIKQLPNSEDQIRTVVKKTGLESVYYRLIGELSKGFRQRTGLAQAMLGNPKVLVLDEPSEGLDPNQRQEIQKLVKELGQKRTVIVSSHVLGEVAKMCNRLMILHQGQIVADGTADELTMTKGGKQIIEVEVKGKGVKTGLKELKGVVAVTDEENSRYRLTVKGSEDMRLAVFQLAKKQNWDLYELTRKKVELAEVFSELTR